MNSKKLAKALFKEGDWVKYHGQIYQVSLAFNPSDNETIYILNRHNSCVFNISEEEAIKNLTKA